MTNYGLIIQPRKVTDFQFGGISGIEKVVLQQDRDWTPYLPVFEKQSASFDTMACVTFSALNCIETLYKRKYGSEINLSDRFTAKMSGTGPQGNDFASVGDSIRKNHGTVAEDVWPAVWASREDYYASIPDSIVALGKEGLKKYNISYEFVTETPDGFWEALQYSPIQICLHAYGSEVNGVFQRTEDPINHAMMLYGGVYGKEWHIYDHYTRLYKKFAWDTKFGGALKYDVVDGMITPPPATPVANFVEGTLFQIVDGAGGFLLQAGGKLRKDDTALLLASWLVRNGGNVIGKAGVLQHKDLEGVVIYNLKSEPVTL